MPGAAPALCPKEVPRRDGPRKHHLAAQQTFRIDANWKLMYDTFGEVYHEELPPPPADGPAV